LSGLLAPRISTSTRPDHKAPKSLGEQNTSSVGDLLQRLSRKVGSRSNLKSESKIDNEDRDKVAALSNNNMTASSVSPNVSASNQSALSRFLGLKKSRMADSTSVLGKTRDVIHTDKEHVQSVAMGISNSSYDIRGISLPNRKMCLDDFHIIRRVGKGGFATVFLVRLKQSTGRYFALKSLHKSELVRYKQETQIMNEKNITLELKHWLIVELYSTFQTSSHLFMIMEFVCGGDLFTLLRRAKYFPEPQAKFYLSQVLIVLEYLHSQNVVYRDLKPEVYMDNKEHID
jgi:hypothetical protein